MLEYDRIDISEGIDIKKCKGTSRESSIFEIKTLVMDHIYVMVVMICL